MVLIWVLIGFSAFFLFWNIKQRLERDARSSDIKFPHWRQIVSTEDLNPLLLQSAVELAALIREEKVSSLEVVNVHIAQIESVNPLLNAMVRDRFEKARKEAKEADARIATNPLKDILPPFLGVPISIKECFALEGMPNSSGLVARRSVISTQDATAVARLRKAGFIPLGVTNTSELCMWMETSNKLYGRTNNPYHPHHIVGGSSGGEGKIFNISKLKNGASIISACGAPVGLGSDIGGSIRMPAFFCGVFGHKPTGGMVPGTGQYPIAEGKALRYLSTGPICRYSEDIFPLLKILAGPDELDHGCLPFELEDPKNVDISKLIVYSIEDNGSLSVDKDLVEIQRKCGEFLASKGATLKNIRLDGLKRSLDIWSGLLNDAGGTPFATLLRNGTPKNFWREFLNFALSKSDHTLPAIGLAVLEGIMRMYFSQDPGITKAIPSNGVRLAGDLKKELSELLGEDGIILYPSYPTVAPLHHKPIFPPFNFVYTAIWNSMELPVTQVPLGLNARGLPLGIQVVSPHGKDHLSIAVAIELEKSFGGWSHRRTKE